jgi:hypothetical protein
MKLFCTFGLMAVAIIGTCSALLAHNKLGDVIMENEQVLDPDGPMILRWTIINETSEIEMELQTNCTGWMGFVFGNGIGQPGAIGDGVIGGYNDELGLGYIEVSVFLFNEYSGPDLINC